MHHRRNRAPMAAIDQINVTPLLDLTFLLLIAFMLTMPLMEYGTGVNPPEMNADKLPEENFLSVTLTPKGTLIVDKETMSREDLVKKLKDLANQKSRPTILVRGDKGSSYGAVVELLTLIRSCGFNDAMLVTQAESAPK